MPRKIDENQLWDLCKDPKEAERANQSHSLKKKVDAFSAW